MQQITPLLSGVDTSDSSSYTSHNILQSAYCIRTLLIISKLYPHNRIILDLHQCACTQLMTHFLCINIDRYPVDRVDI